MSRLFRRICLLLTCLGATVAVLRAQVGPAVPKVTRPAATEEALPPEIEALLAGQPSWTASASVHDGVGYKDNLLLSHAEPEQSGFTRGGIETLLWRLPANRIDYFGFLNAEGTQYFAGKSVHHEAQAFAGLEWRYRIGDVFTFAFDGQGYYLDQIFDVSDTDIQRVVAELRIAGVKGGPTIRWAPLSWLWVEATATAGQESLDQKVVGSGAETKDHTRVTEPTLRLGWRPSDRFELSASGTERRRGYAVHPRYTVRGRIDTGVLAIHERDLEGKATLTLGAGRHWQTTTRVGTLHYTDNGSGYLNYRERRAAQEIDWSVGNWSVTAEGEAKRRDYQLQTVGLGIAVQQQIKDEFTTSLRVERKLTPHWTVYAEYNWERVRSNDTIASYRVNEGLLGARWSWEK